MSSSTHLISPLFKTNQIRLLVERLYQSSEYQAHCLDGLPGWHYEIGFSVATLVAPLRLTVVSPLMQPGGFSPTTDNRAD